MPDEIDGFFRDRSVAQFIQLEQGGTFGQVA